MLRALAKRRVLGRARLQTAFVFLHRVSLGGMNFGPSRPAGTGELRVLDLVAARARTTPPVVFDVGANTGEYATAVLERLGERARLYCFEPSRHAFERLADAVAGRAEVLNFALGERNGSAELHFDVAGSPIASLFPRRMDHLGVAMDDRETVEVRRLDDFCRDNGIERIDLLKLDVEGNELNVLQGAGTLLEDGAIDVIQFEFGGSNVDSRTFFRDFYELLTPRYRIHRIVRDGLVPIDRYREEDEIFVTVNYVAIMRS